MKRLVFTLALAWPSLLVGAPPDGYLSGESTVQGPAGLGLAPEPVTGAPGPKSFPNESHHAPTEPSLVEIEGRLATVLARAFHYPRTLSVKLTPRVGHPVSSGRFERLAVDFTQGRFDILPVEQARLRLGRTVVDMTALDQRGEFVSVEEGPLDLRLVVGQSGLNEVLALRRKSLAIDDAQLSIHDGKVHLSGWFRTSWFKGRIFTAGTFAINHGTRIHYLPERVAVGPLPLPSGAVAAIARKINPVFDLSRIKGWRGLSLQLARIELTGDSVILESTDISKFESIAARWEPVPQPRLPFIGTMIRTGAGRRW